MTGVGWIGNTGLKNSMLEVCIKSVQIFSISEIILTTSKNSANEIMLFVGRPGRSPKGR
jgi:hypothetical protein